MTGELKTREQWIDAEGRDAGDEQLRGWAGANPPMKSTVIDESIDSYDRKPTSEEAARAVVAAERDSDPDAIFERHASHLRVGDEIWIGDSEGPGGCWADVVAVRLSDRPVVRIWWARDDIDEGEVSELGDETILTRRPA